MMTSWNTPQSVLYHPILARLGANRYLTYERLERLEDNIAETRNNNKKQKEQIVMDLGIPPMFYDEELPENDNSSEDMDVSDYYKDSYTVSQEDDD
jgi:hypothetical protein